MKKSIYQLLLFIPLMVLGQSQDQNYKVTKTYKKESTGTITPDDISTGVEYFDGLGRPVQTIAVKAGGTGKDIVVPIVYEQGGSVIKQHLPYVNTAQTASSQDYRDPAALLVSLNGYYQSKFPGELSAATPNPYSEIMLEQSPLGRTLQIAAPGADWAMVGGIHTQKIVYDTNLGGSFVGDAVYNFSVKFYDGDTEVPALHVSGFYPSASLYKKIVKDENWVPTDAKNKTTEEFTDVQGRLILRRNYNNSQSHDTYYVYDKFSNLTYVIPPLAADEVVIESNNFPQLGVNFAWTRLALVDQQLADDYDTELSAYDNEEILNLDLLDKYGGQGGFTVSAAPGGNVSLILNITSNDTLNLRTGIIVANVAAVKDQEIGRLQGTGYDYTFHVTSGDLVVSGGGGIPPGALNVFLAGGVPLEYSRNYPWTRLTKADEWVADDYEKAIAELDNSQILNTYTANTYGAVGGINISIDNEDTVMISLNLTSVTPLELQTGALFQLDAFRRIADRELGTVSGIYDSVPYSYTLSIKDNSLYVTGSGQFAQLTLLDTRSSRPVYEIKTQVVEGLCYIYHYDKRNRVIEKKIPGKDWDHIIYDRLDRIVATQNPFLRQNGYWITTKYDVFDRVAYTARIADARTRAELQAYLDGLVNPLLNVIRTQNVSHTGQGLTLNYTGTVHPTNSANIYTVNYYDDYSYDMAGITVPIANHYGDTLSINTKGMMTATKVRALDTYIWETSITGYDEKGRGVWNHRKNGYLNTENIRHTDFDFTGKANNVRTVHKKTGLPDLVTTDHFEYDAMGRLLRHSQVVGSHQAQLIAYNEYDELGQLKSKKVGDTYNNLHNYAATTGLQSVDYTYNIRGWLTGINDTGEDLGTSADLFAFSIKYNTGTAPLYNGNISETYWKSKTDNRLRGYTYQYDALNRLEKSIYVGNYERTQNPGQYENYTEGPISYDKNGNIKTLERYGLKANNTIDKIDVLSYSYFPYSNQPRGVNDTADAAGFDNKATGSNDDYSYDSGGNLKKDLNKGYGTRAQWETLYNHLNLPRQVKWGSSKHINYVYDATGVKLEKKVTDGSSITTTQYDGGYVYKDNVLQYFAHGEGYVNVGTPVNNAYTNFEYIYQYKDHLGNVRLSYLKNSVSGNLQVIEEENYYAFGMKHAGYNNAVTGLGNATAQKLGYNGIELEEYFDLDMYEMWARQYDPVLGKFNTIDPLAETTFSESPYHFGYNNPVYWADPSGLSGIPGFIAVMWNATTDGTNSSWTNNGDGSFTGNIAGISWLLDADTLNMFMVDSMEMLPELIVNVDKRKGQSIWSEVNMYFGSHVYSNARVYSDYRSNIRWNQAHDFLDMTGFIDPTGIADGINAGLYSYRGQYGMAAISIAAIVPYVGDGAKVLKRAVKIQKHHIIPKAVYRTMGDELSAIMKLNGGSNLKKLPAGFHGNHPAYSQYVIDQINLLKQANDLNPGSIRALQKDLNSMINKAYDSYPGGGNLNDFFKGINK